MPVRDFIPHDFIDGVQGVIFDCDGVIVDSKDANRMYYNMVRQKLGLLSMTPEEEEYVHAHAVGPSIAHIIPADRLEEAEKARKEIDFQEMLEYTYLQPGLVELLQDLKQAGFRLGVNTNRTDSMELLLETFDLTHFFEPVITAAKVKHPKPNPEGVHKILRAWDMTRFQVAYIGDSSVDEMTAKAAGVPFWAFKNHKLAARHHVDGFEKLLEDFRQARG